MLASAVCPWWSTLRYDILPKDLFLRIKAIGTASIIMFSQLGCTTRPENVAPRYVSPVGYRSWTCDQLSEERTRLVGEVERVAGLQRENANADAALMTVGLVIFWPALFGLAATTDRRDELSRLRGEYEAVEADRRGKSCTNVPPVGAQSAASQISSVPMSPQSNLSSINQPGPFGTTAINPTEPTPICAPAGISWTVSGQIRASVGSDSVQPEICIIQTESGNTERLIYNFHPSGRAADRPIRDGMRSLFPLGIGRSADFIFVGTTRSNNEFQYRETWEVTGEDLLQINTQQRPAWTVRRIQRGLGGNYFNGEETIWIDKSTGIHLRRILGSTQGLTTSRGYTVSSIQDRR